MAAKFKSARPPSPGRGNSNNPKMSSRLLRKLQGENELEISHGDEEDEDYFNLAAPVKSKKRGKPVVNPFDLVSATCI